MRYVRFRPQKTTGSLHDAKRETKDTRQAGDKRVNCPHCLGRLWIQDADGDFFRCENCLGTGEYANKMDTVVDISVAHSIRSRRRRPKVDKDDTGGDAA